MTSEPRDALCPSQSLLGTDQQVFLGRVGPDLLPSSLEAPIQPGTCSYFSSFWAHPLQTQAALPLRWSRELIVSEMFGMSLGNAASAAPLGELQCT